VGSVPKALRVEHAMNAEGTTETRRRCTAAPVLEHGFRPFFLVAGLWAAVSMLLWIAMLAGLVRIPTAFAPVDWHVHALLFGFVPAVLAGFLLTAVPNWTGRPALAGRPLLVLVAVWLAGRVVVTGSAAIAPAVAAAVDLGFLASLGQRSARKSSQAGTGAIFPCSQRSGCSGSATCSSTWKRPMVVRQAAWDRGWRWRPWYS
jgi:hypothetical protein